MLFSSTFHGFPIRVQTLLGGDHSFADIVVYKDRSDTSYTFWRPQADMQYYICFGNLSRSSWRAFCYAAFFHLVLFFRLTFFG
jgi:hypothetical protein